MIRMRLPLTLVFRSLRKTPSRAILMVLGLATVCGTLTTTFIYLDSLNYHSLSLASESVGEIDLSITRPFQKETFWSDFDYGSYFDPRNALQALNANSSFIEVFKGVTIRHFFAVEVNISNKLITAPAIASNFTLEDMLGIGRLEPRFQFSDPPAKIENLTQFHPEIVLSSDFEPLIGDSAELPLKIEVENETIEFNATILGYVTDHLRFGAISTGLYLLFDLKWISTALNSIPFVYSVFEKYAFSRLVGTFKNPEKIYKVENIDGMVKESQKLGNMIQEVLNRVTIKPFELQVSFPRISEIRDFEDSMIYTRIYTFFVSTVVAIIGGLLFFGIATTNFRERIREFGILRTLGLKNREIWLLTIMEGLFLIIGSDILGLFGGTFFSILFFDMIIPDAKVGPIVRPSSLMNSAVICLIIGIGCVVVPAYKCSRIRIVEANSPSGRPFATPTFPSRRRYALLLVLYGFILSIVSIFVYFIVPMAFTRRKPGMLSLIYFLTIITLLLGTSLIGVGGILPISEKILIGLTSLFTKTQKVTEIVARSLTANRRRYTTTALILTFTFAFIIYSGSVREVDIEKSTWRSRSQIGADISIRKRDNGFIHNASDPFSPFPSNIKDTILKQSGEIRSISGVTPSLNQPDFGLKAYAGDAGYILHISARIWGIDSNFSSALFTDTFQFREGDLKDFEEVTSSTTHHAIISGALASYLNLKKGDTLRIHLESRDPFGTTDSLFQISAIVEKVPGFSDHFHTSDIHASNDGIFISLNAWLGLIQDLRSEVTELSYNYLFVKTDPDNAKVIGSRLKASFSVGTSVLLTQSAINSIKETAKEAIMLYTVLSILGGTLGLFGVITSMYASVKERYREIGILRGLGLRNRDVRMAILLESLILTSSSSLVGSIAGFVISLAFQLQSAWIHEAPLFLSIPWYFIGLLFIFSLLIGLIGALVPTTTILRKRTVREFL